MPRTLSGLVSAEFDSINVFHSVLVRGSPGKVQTVLTSDGVGCDWAAVTLNANAVDTLHIKDDAVIDTKIKDNAVTTDKILDGNVTSNKIAVNAVTTHKILDGNVRSGMLYSAKMWLKGLVLCTPG